MPRGAGRGLRHEEPEWSIFKPDSDDLPPAGFRVEIDGLVLPGLVTGTGRGADLHERRKRDHPAGGNEGITPGGRVLPPDTGMLAVLTACLDLVDCLRAVASRRTSIDDGDKNEALSSAGLPKADAFWSLQDLFGTQFDDRVGLATEACRDAAVVAGGRGSVAARLPAIKADLMLRLGDPTLSAASVSRRHRIGSRRLQRLFKQDGTTFTAFMLEARLTRAHCQLSHPDRKREPITTVALENGFGDLSYFCRTFKKRFGCSASRMRKAHDIPRELR